MSRRGSKGKKNSKSLKITFLMFIITGMVALFIVWNKGNIGGYSLIKIETPTSMASEEQEEQKSEMEISVEKKYLSVRKKEESPILVMIDGEEVSLDEVELTSSNEDVIKIKNGVAVAVSVGKSTITATKDDLTATVDLRAIIPITSMTFTTTNSTVRVGKSLQMKLVAKPSDANIETLKYESSDEDIATVNSNGIVTGVSPGTVTITVTDKYSELTKSVKLTIRK